MVVEYSLPPELEAALQRACAEAWDAFDPGRDLTAAEVAAAARFEADHPGLQAYMREAHMIARRYARKAYDANAEILGAMGIGS